MPKVVWIRDPACITTADAIRAELLKHYAQRDVKIIKPRDLTTQKLSGELEPLAGAFILARLAKQDGAEVVVSMTLGAPNIDMGVVETKRSDMLVFTFYGNGMGDAHWMKGDATKERPFKLPSGALAALVEIIATRHKHSRA